MNPINDKAHGPLKPNELAQSSVLAALTATIVVIGTSLPFLGPLRMLALVPMGVVGYRCRLRALATATISAAAIAFAMGGLRGVMLVWRSVFVGGLTGVVRRQGWGLVVLAVLAAAWGAVFAAVAVVALAILSRLRLLLLDTLRAVLEGLFALIAHLPYLQNVEEHSPDVVEFIVNHWGWFIGGLVFVMVLVRTFLGWWVLSRILDRLAAIPDVHQLDPLDECAVIEPIPVRLRGVRFRYRPDSPDALAPTSLSIDIGEHVALTGPNGSGKSTLMCILAGRPPTGGDIHRPGAIGLGAVGGTAIVMQHPESQVLGTKVADDVVWGLPADHRVDVDGLLDAVGLYDVAEHSTSALSGGQLQRLAIAAALARTPSLLIADEITSMLDQRGRRELMAILSRLAAQRRMSLLHITHSPAEAAAADREIVLSPINHTRVDPDTSGYPSSVTKAAPPRSSSSPVVLELTEVNHQYASGTPWAKTALRDISLTVRQGEGILICGDNGSGKSTLAWIAAGLTKPTSGQCLLDGQPVTKQVGQVAISFQAARLQLFRSRVSDEIASAAGFSVRDTNRVLRALSSVGLGSDLAERPVDQLSGGQMRRVALAGLLARSPRVLVLDEPLAGLDTQAQASLLGLLTEIRQRQGLTILVISHDYEGMQALCPRTVHLQSGRLVDDNNLVAAAGGYR
ncbi:ABC transporter ATP-binding protein [Mycobacteroides abscessus]|uniref:ABC transporter ATP-binding protein n=1 Tax=Mycobacteroides abscessus TaxID=36809 RepID=UPI00266D7AB5|nr:ABC transporter ATP-binding protein [Mycobacteroides abscessus]MDO2970935.1 ATP-binding cassette domain-containing protein [Mycobacteroides abscessus subsp. bolletii]MDO3078320.1 ATP-binding cassette domain-containing protein [Mycobacteroides abscessus subsp. bolletii]